MQVDPSAGTASVVARAQQAQVRPPGVQAPAAPPIPDRNGSNGEVDRLFQVLHQLGQELQGTFDGAESRRIAGQEGMDSHLSDETVQKAEANLQSLLQRTGQAGESARGFLRDLRQAVSGGEASTASLARHIHDLQASLAERYGFVGHLVNRTA